LFKNFTFTSVFFVFFVYISAYKFSSFERAVGWAAGRASGL